MCYYQGFAFGVLGDMPVVDMGPALSRARYPRRQQGLLCSGSATPPSALKTMHDNSSNAETTFVQSTMKQRFLKII